MTQVHNYTSGRFIVTSLKKFRWKPLEELHTQEITNGLTDGQTDGQTVGQPGV